MSKYCGNPWPSGRGGHPNSQAPRYIPPNAECPPVLLLSEASIVFERHSQALLSDSQAGKRTKYRDTKNKAPFNTSLSSGGSRGRWRPARQPRERCRPDPAPQRASTSPPPSRPLRRPAAPCAASGPSMPPLPPPSLPPLPTPAERKAAEARTDCASSEQGATNACGHGV